MISTSDITTGNESLVHFGGVRIRVNGTGNLIPTLGSLDKIRTQSLRNFVMQQTTDREKFQLANFMSQRAYLRLETLNINETFRINRIIVYVKPVYSQFVGE